MTFFRGLPAAVGSAVALYTVHPAAFVGADVDGPRKPVIPLRVSIQLTASHTQAEIGDIVHVTAVFTTDGEPAEVRASIGFPGPALPDAGDEISEMATRTGELVARGKRWDGVLRPGTELELRGRFRANACGRDSIRAMCIHKDSILPVAWNAIPICIQGYRQSDEPERVRAPEPREPQPYVLEFDTTGADSLPQPALQSSDVPSPAAVSVPPESEPGPSSPSSEEDPCCLDPAGPDEFPGQPESVPDSLPEDERNRDRSEGGASYQLNAMTRIVVVLGLDTR